MNNPELNHTGVFSRIGMPEQWNENMLAEDKPPLLNQIKLLMPKSEVLAEISRSSHSATFVVRNNHELMVCQFSPVIKDHDTNENLKRERLNPWKFVHCQHRLNHIASSGASVPKILDSGFAEQLHRSFAVMEFIKGLSADRFLKDVPENTADVFKLAGAEIGKLSSVELREQDAPSIDSKVVMINKVTPHLEFLQKNGVFSLDQIKEIQSGMEKRLKEFPELPLTYVHLDPFPVNWHISGNRANLKLTLMDIEAIQTGHPWLEGIGRMIQWAGNDWFLITKNSPIANIPTALINEFNNKTRVNVRLPNNFNLELLTDTCELFWLPQAIVFELLKESPQETPNRRKNNILSIIGKKV